MSDAIPIPTPPRDVGTLLEALPYIRDFHGKTVVIKYGGAAMEDRALREDFARDVVLLKYVGLNPIVVHGGGPEITDYMDRLGITVEFVDGLRVSNAGHGRSGEDGPDRQGQQGHRAAARPPRPARGRAVRRRRAAVPRRAPDRARRQDIGFVGRIEHVDADVINHIAADYIPVVASVAADREGVSYNINADEAAGAVAGALGAFKLMFLTDVEGWLRDPADPQSIVSEASAAEVIDALPSVSGGMRPKLQACVDAIAGGVTLRAHRRRSPAALAAARAVHRRGHRDEDHGMSLAELQALERERVIPTYARFPVEFVRGEGARLWDDEGNEYLDFLAGISVSSVGHCHPAVVAAVREQAGRLMHVDQPLLHRAADAAGRAAVRALAGRQGVLLQLGRRGRRGRDQARAQGAPRRQHRGRSSRRSTVARTGRCRPRRRNPSRSRSRRSCPGSSWCPRTRRRSKRRWTRTRRRCCSSRSRASRASTSSPMSCCARRGRPAIAHGARADLRRDPVRHGPHRHALGIRALGVTPDAMTVAKALGGGMPIGALITGPRLADVLATRRPRVDVRGRPGRGRRRRSPCSTSWTTKRCSSGSASWANASRRASPSSRACARSAGAG